MESDPPLTEVIVFLVLVVGASSAICGWFYALFSREGSLAGKGYIDQWARDWIRPARVIMWGGLVLLAVGVGLMLGLWAARAVSDLASQPSIGSASRTFAVVGLAVGGWSGLFYGLGQILPFERFRRLASVPTWMSRIARLLFWPGTGLLILAAVLGLVAVADVGGS